MTTTEITQQIEQAEDAYEALAATIGPLWGHEQSDELARLAETLRRLYAEAGTDDFDRIQL